MPSSSMQHVRWSSLTGLKLCVLFIIFSLFILSHITCATTDEDKERASKMRDECVENGFVPEKLACNVCKEMSTFISDAMLINQCKACCNPALDEEKRYESATIEVCRMKLPSHPELQNFISKRADLFKTLQIRFKVNANPTLLMKKKKASSKLETLSIEKWSNDDLFNYLSQSIN